MRVRLALATAQADDANEGEQLARIQVERAARVGVAEAVGRERVLQEHLVGRGVSAHRVDHGAEDGPLGGNARIQAIVLGHGRLRLEWERDAVRPQYLLEHAQALLRLGEPGVGCRLVEDLLELGCLDALAERRVKDELEVVPLDGREARCAHEQALARVEHALLPYLAEREVVLDGGEFRERSHKHPIVPA